MGDMQSATPQASKLGGEALKAVTGLKKDTEELKKLLDPKAKKTADLIESMSKHLPSLKAYFKPGTDRLGGTASTPYSSRQAIDPVNQAVKTLCDSLEGKESKLMIEVNESLAPIVTKLEGMVKDLETLKKDLKKSGYN